MHQSIFSKRIIQNVILSVRPYYLPEFHCAIDHNLGRHGIEQLSVLKWNHYCYFFLNSPLKGSASESKKKQGRIVHKNGMEKKNIAEIKFMRKQRGHTKNFFTKKIYSNIKYISLNKYICKMYIHIGSFLIKL